MAHRKRTTRQVLYLSQPSPERFLLDIVLCYIFHDPRLAQLSTLAAWRNPGIIRTIAGVYPLTEAAQANEMLEAGEVQGKLVLKCAAE